ncbi:type III-A CRISPR-associated RAMP protein Csm5 [Tolypothrix sp. VBCCA 56010]|uniref:type III-A CRISPR-associated RAMP protein Csm5 n=1 Tax=Tolypothrix sp. VBCCA 56010 TaxID=3137731 RepID=UPI003D7DA415
MLASPILKKPDTYESKRIRLESPILHIGSSVSRLSPFEYVDANNKVYLPNQEAIAKALKKQGGRFLDDYIQAINDRQDITNLLKQAFGDEWWNIVDADGEAIFPKSAISQKLTEERITDLRPMIRNGMGQLYIPGSSIKGAIKTAIVYHLLKYADKYKIPSEKRVSEIEKKLRSKLGTLNKHQHKFLDDDLFMDLFSDFTLTYQDRVFTGRSQNTDFLRALKVSDSEPLIERRITTKQKKQIRVNFSVVAEVIVSSRFPDHLAKYKASIYAEMLRNVHTEFTLTLDTEMLTWFKHKQKMQLPFSTLNELIKICQEFAQDQWDYEHDYWNDIKNNPRAGRNLDFNYIREIYEPEKSPYALRLGWGSGMTGTTVDLLFDDELREEIRDTCGLKAPDFEAPKSRRSVVNADGEIKFIPGWIKLKVL